MTGGEAEPAASPAGNDPARFSHERTNERVLALVTREPLSGRRLLDFGAGEGYFSRRLGDYIQARYGIPPAEVLRACDLHPAAFRYSGIPCDPIAPDGSLPYPDASFDIVCCIEVVEHLEDQFRFARELFRVLRPGGRAFLTTPNVLNINSRVRFLHSGFGLLFDPLPLATHDAVHLAGHIHPVSFYYLGYLLRRAGFSAVHVHFDRTKKSGLAWLVLLAPFLLAARALAAVGRRGQRAALYAENQELMRPINSLRMLTSRSVIAEAVK